MVSGGLRRILLFLENEAKEAKEVKEVKEVKEGGE